MKKIFSSWPWQLATDIDHTHFHRHNSNISFVPMFSFIYSVFVNSHDPSYCWGQSFSSFLDDFSFFNSSKQIFEHCWNEKKLRKFVRLFRRFREPLEFISLTFGMELSIKAQQKGKQARKQQKSHKTLNFQRTGTNWWLRPVLYTYSHPILDVRFTLVTSHHDLSQPVRLSFQNLRKFTNFMILKIF